MTIRFFILQTHYRSTLDFSNEALQAAEKGLRRLMDAYEWLKQLAIGNEQSPAKTNTELDEKIQGLLSEFDEFMNDDFSTAKVLANMFELVPVINSLKDKSILIESLPVGTLRLMQEKLKIYLEDILGLKLETLAEEDKLNAVMEVLITLRKEARTKKDWATSDKIRNQLAEAGVLLKDEKDGGMSWTLK
jgi:cysteinyl-tRNA synthetase